MSILAMMGSVASQDDIYKTILYDKGYENTPLTGGWVSETSGIGGTVDYLPIIKNTDSMSRSIGSSSAGNACSPITNNKVSLDGVDFIDFDITLITGGGAGTVFKLGVSDFKNTDASGFVAFTFTQTFGRSIVSLDVSSLSGTYYTRVLMYTGINAYLSVIIHSIKLR